MDEWIGKPKITVELQPKIADRDDYLVRAVGPGPTDYTFPLSLTGTILAIWDKDSGEAAVFLTQALLRVAGTASVPPKQGFWFDSYNSGITLKETESKIYNEGARQFIKNRSIHDIFGMLLGDEVSDEIDTINKFFSEKYKIPLFSSLEEAFELSQFAHDLNKPPGDYANYIYRICILSSVIDHFGIKPLDTLKSKCKNCGFKSDLSEGSFQSFKRWLSQQIGDKRSLELTQTFQMIKNLRKQYPIHDQFETRNSLLQIRKEIVDANTYFEITEPKSYDHNWGVILNNFNKALKELIVALS